MRLHWVEAPEHATVFTLTVVHHAIHPAVTGRMPNIVAVVDFPQLPQVRLVTNVTDVDPAMMRIGLSVRLWWDRLADDDAAGRPMYLPRFRPAEGLPA